MSVPSEENLYVIAKRDSEDLVTSSMKIGEPSKEETAAIFTTDAKALAYLQQAGWVETETAAALTHDAVIKWLKSVAESGVKYVTVDPDRVHQDEGILQRVLVIDDLLKQDAKDAIRALIDSSEPVTQ